MAFCIKCGAELAQNAKFCVKCGSPVGDGDTSSAGDGIACS